MTATWTTLVLLLAVLICNLIGQIAPDPVEYGVLGFYSEERSRGRPSEDAIKGILVSYKLEVVSICVEVL